jgi:uncharacterized protein YprB with RNaseH-like and TPR domain
MLDHTFRHLKGIGSKKERDLWRSGILSWNDFEQRSGRQLTIFPDQLDCTERDFTTSRQALKEENADFFAQRLSKEDYYRIALTFFNKTLFLDIGFSHICYAYV